ncbi:MAG: hypothetical protein WD969_15705 [Paracoccaceae bacterium]
MLKEARRFRSAPRKFLARFRPCSGGPASATAREPATRERAEGEKRDEHLRTRVVDQLGHFDHVRAVEGLRHIRGLVGPEALLDHQIDDRGVGRRRVVALQFGEDADIRAVGGVVMVERIQQLAKRRRFIGRRRVETRIVAWPAPLFPERRRAYLKVASRERR